jgi:hypothetical protein
LHSCPEHGRFRLAGKWLAVAVLSAVAGALAVTLWQQTPPAAAQNGAASTAAPGVVIVAGQIARDSYGLYLVDVPNSTICLYQYVPADAKTGKLYLKAARTFVYDRQLDEWNTEPPPSSLSDRVAGARRLKDVQPSTNP